MLLNALLEAAERVPGKLAVDDGLRALTYKRLADLAAVMRDVILREVRGDKVGIMLPACAPCPAVLFGALWASKKAVPLNFLLHPAELAHVVADAGLDTILTVRHFAALADGLGARPVFLEDLPLKRKMVTMMLRRRPPVPNVQPDETAVILYTSGTTAEPRGVELTHANLHSNCRDTIASLEIEPAHVFLNVLPPFHVFGLTAMVLCPVFLGASVYALPRFSPVGVIKASEEHAISVLVAIPSMYAAILRTKSAKADSFRSIRLAFSGGEPLPQAVRNGFLERFGVTLLEGYGLTETAPVVAANTLQANRPGTVGRPIHNVRLRIVGPDDWEQTCGREGEVLVRGPGVMKGYYRRPDDTRNVMDEQGWLRTGDIGRIDEDGFLSITGRKKELLIIGGENVLPREIEAALEAHEGVLQAAVIGVPDDLRGEVPIAFVIPEHGLTVTEAELRQFAKQSLAGFKVPRRIEIRDELPKGPTGKILKRRLRELL